MESALRPLAKENAMERKKMSGLQVSSFFSTHMINTTRATSFASGDHKCVWKWEINVKFPPQSSPTTRILTFLEKQVQGGHQSKLWDCKLMNRHFSPHTPSIFPRLTCNLVFLLLTFLRTFKVCSSVFRRRRCWILRAFWLETNEHCICILPPAAAALWTNIVQKLVHCFWSTLPNACVQFTTKNKTNAIQTSFRFYLLTDIHISCYEKVDMDDS